MAPFGLVCASLAAERGSGYQDMVTDRAKALVEASSRLVLAEHVEPEGWIKSAAPVEGASIVCLLTKSFIGVR